VRINCLINTSPFPSCPVCRFWSSSCPYPDLTSPFLINCSIFHMETFHSELLILRWFSRSVLNPLVFTTHRSSPEQIWWTRCIQLYRVRSCTCSLGDRSQCLYHLASYCPIFSPAVEMFCQFDHRFGLSNSFHRP
jgi:hypothetical protein